MSLTLQRRGIVEEYKGYNFRRESMAQDSQGKLIYPHNARFESGPFAGDKAVMVEEGTVNLIPKDKQTFEGWQKAPGVTITPNATIGPTGNLDASMFETTTASFWFFVFLDNPQEGASYTFSWWAKKGTMQTNKYSVYDETHGTTIIQPTTYYPTDLWQRFAVTVTVPVGCKHLRFYPERDTQSLGTTYLYGPQLEAKPYATTFTPSVRADESLTVPIEGLLSPEQGTVEVWTKLLKPASGMVSGSQNYGVINIGEYYKNNSLTLRAYDNNGNEPNLYLLIKGSTNIGWSIGGSPIKASGSGWYEGWNHYAITWINGNDFTIYFNGELRNTFNITDPFTGVSGNKIYYNATLLLASHLRLSSIARTAEQLAPLDGPPPVDEWTTLYLPFGGADGTRAAKSIVI